ncbi:MAG: SufD family Fe-S cluster assembly protein [Chloroflexi bacterium]|nr:MAG: SufD family Fe-S cluster assembly protein [Chloroflexota bacterium]
MASAAPLTQIPLLLDRKTVEQHSLRRGEPDWLRESRLHALERFTPESWPSGEEEEWRRFPLSGLPTGPLASTLDHLPGIQFKLEPDAIAAGVIFKGLTRAALDNPQLVRPHIVNGDGIPSHAAFRAAADALWSAGSSFVHVPAGVVVRQPLVLEKIWPASDDAMLSRTIVVAERDSTVTLVEDLSSRGDAPRIAIPHVEVHVGAGARVWYVGIRRWAPGVLDLGFQRYRSARDSELRSLNVFAGEGRSKVGLESDIEGDGAIVKLFGLVAAGDSQRIDVNSFQSVDGRASQSDLLYLSALYDRAKAIFYGKIRVEPTSHATGSYQECRNMLLSDEAGADPIPVLEILTNDVVRCGHGATAGALSDEELFYAMSRGFDRDEAQQLLVHGFFRRVINELADEHVRQRVLNAVRPRIGNIAEMGVLE